MTRIYDAAVVGGGPSGATAAADLAAKGLDVVLLDRRRAESSRAAAPFRRGCCANSTCPSI